jgi:nucleoside-diphosphate-sugar epimerase
VIVVAGGSGTLGTRLVLRLAGQGLAVRVLTPTRPGRTTWPARGWRLPGVMSATPPASPGRSAAHPTSTS